MKKGKQDKRRIGKGILLIALAGCLSGCGSTTEETSESEVVKEQGTWLNESLRYETTNTLPISDNDSLYELDEDLEVVTMYLTVQQGSESDGTKHTWKEVNENSAYYYDALGIERYKVDAILQVGNENGPVFGEFGYGSLIPNATVSIRGQTSTQSKQKNYKIKILDGKGSYKNQTTINLNKHVGDGLRFRNKLCYDLMEELPDMMSARTQFVHLYVKDLTQGEQAQFEDYGIYTQVEQINKTYLKNHGLDRNGQLYKINFFEFYRYEDIIMPTNDADYDGVAFEEYIEIKGSSDHTKLIAMLEDLNNDSIPIEETFVKWFDEENVFSWLAFHILVGNKDTQSRNCFLYSPLNVNKWYFISWDNDGAFLTTERAVLDWRDGLEWQSGVSNYWGNVLFRKVLKSEEYRNKLDEKICEYKAILTEEKIRDMAAGYDSVVKSYVESMPDLMYLPVTLEQRQRVIEEFPKEVEQNYQDYLLSLEKPQPFFIGTPIMSGDGIELTWDLSYSFDEEEITYTVELDDDYSFIEPIYKEDGIYSPGIEIPIALEPGKYFVRLTARDEEGYEQFAFDVYHAERGNQYGMKCFYVLENGEIVEDTYVEGE